MSNCIAKNKPEWPYWPGRKLLAQYFNLYKKNYCVAKKKKNISDEVQKESFPGDNKKTADAHIRADKDIEQDPDLSSKTNLEDKIDEGELTRLEEED